jgi:hypothetical protein
MDTGLYAVGIAAVARKRADEKKVLMRQIFICFVFHRAVLLSLR